MKNQSNLMNQTMANNEKLPHHLIAAVITDSLNKDEREEIQILEDEDPVCKLVVDSIVTCRKLSEHAETKWADQTISYNLAELDEMISEILTGNPSIDTARQFLSSVLLSPQFYQRLLMRFTNIVQISRDEDIPKMSDIRIKSDNEILTQLMPNLNPIQDADSDAAEESKPKILRFPLFAKPIVARISYAAAALFIATAGGLFGIRFYNTTYQIMLAESQLNENMKIYYAETPRLSGGYGSTGISKLMGPDDENQLHLNEASSRIEKAIASGSKSTDARKLQAQIFVFRENYSGADSILNLVKPGDQTEWDILNDRGVIAYKQRNWPEANRLFEAAIAENDQQPEAYYNLALAKVKLGDSLAAIDLINKYLEFDNEIEWKNAARNLLRQLTESEHN